MSVHKVPRKNKKGYEWQVRRRDEQGINRSWGVYEHKDDAEDRDDEVRRLIRDGDLVPREQSETLVETFYREVLLKTRRASDATKKRWGAAWGPKKRQPEVWHVGEKWSAWKLEDVNRPAAVHRWHREMEAAGATDSQIRTAHNFLVMLVGHAVAMGYLDRSRIEGIRVDYTPDREVHRDVWLPEEVELIRAYLLSRATHVGRGGPNGKATRAEYQWRRRRDAELVAFMGYHGPRPGEAVAITWPQLLDRKDIVRVVEIVDTARAGRRRGTKTRVTRLIPLQEQTRRDLRLWWMACGQPTQGPVFPLRMGEIGDRTAKWTEVDVSNWRENIWKPALAAVGLPYKPPKHLRHSCVSMWIKENLDLKTVADRSGHSMTVCEQTYAHQFEQRKHSDEAFTIATAIPAARSDVRGMFALADASAAGSTS